MRNIFIDSLECLVNLSVVLGGILIVAGAGLALADPYRGGVVPALGILAVGIIYLVLMAGFIYLQIGIHANTKRTADAVEALLARR